MTFKQKWDNYWYYYKTHTIVGTLILILLLLTIRDCANKVEPDFSAIYVGSVYKVSESLEAEIAEFVGDINGDGKNELYFDNILIPKEPKSEMDLQMSQKLLLTFVSRDVRLFIIEDEFMERYGDSFEPLEGILPSEKLQGGKEYEGKKIGMPASNSVLLQKHGFTGDDLYVGVLLIGGDDKKKPDIDVKFNTSIQVLQFLAE